MTVTFDGETAGGRSFLAVFEVKAVGVSEVEAARMSVLEVEAAGG